MTTPMNTNMNTIDIADFLTKYDELRQNYIALAEQNKMLVERVTKNEADISQMKEYINSIHEDLECASRKFKKQQDKIVSLEQKNEHIESNLMAMREDLENQKKVNVEQMIDIFLNKEYVSSNESSEISDEEESQDDIEPINKTTDKKYICNCGKVHQTKEGYWTHKQLSPECEKIWNNTCVCGKVCKSKGGMTIHKKHCKIIKSQTLPIQNEVETSPIQEPQPPITQFKCDCGKVLKNKGGYMSHKQHCKFQMNDTNEVNTNMNDELKCECGKVLKNKGAFKMHKKHCKGQCIQEQPIIEETIIEEPIIEEPIIETQPESKAESDYNQCDKLKYSKVPSYFNMTVEEVKESVEEILDSLEIGKFCKEERVYTNCKIPKAYIDRYNGFYNEFILRTKIFKKYKTAFEFLRDRHHHLKGRHTEKEMSKVNIEKRGIIAEARDKINEFVHKFKPIQYGKDMSYNIVCELYNEISRDIVCDCDDGECVKCKSQFQKQDLAKEKWRNIEKQITQNLKHQFWVADMPQSFYDNLTMKTANETFRKLVKNILVHSFKNY